MDESRNPGRLVRNMETIDIRNPFPGARSFLLASTASTQEEARTLASAAARAFPHGSLVAAEAQTAGRGRYPERRWDSEAGKNLLFTVFLASGTAALPGLPLRIGSALCSATEAYARGYGMVFARRPRLKWPNDLMFGDRKAGGILCEAGKAGVFAGIGINCNQVDFPPGIEGGATSLAAESGARIDRWALLELFLVALKASLDDSGWLRSAEDALWRKGQAATFLPGSEARGQGGGRGPRTGTIEGLGGDGSLLFKEDGDETARPYASGELRAAGTS